MYAKNKKMLFWLILFVAIIMLVKLYDVSSVNNQMDVLIDSYNKELDKTKTELKDTNDKKDYYNSDDYIEKVAREQGNLTKKNDIVFITGN